jgi:hypothetical protein
MNAHCCLCGKEVDLYKKKCTKCSGRGSNNNKLICTTCYAKRGTCNDCFYSEQENQNDFQHQQPEGAPKTSKKSKTTNNLTTAVASAIEQSYQSLSAPAKGVTNTNYVPATAVEAAVPAAAPAETTTATTAAAAATTAAAIGPAGKAAATAATATAAATAAAATAAAATAAAATATGTAATGTAAAAVTATLLAAETGAEPTVITSSAAAAATAEKSSIDYHLEQSATSNSGDGQRVDQQDANEQKKENALIQNPGRK